MSSTAATIMMALSGMANDKTISEQAGGAEPTKKQRLTNPDLSGAWNQQKKKKVRKKAQEKLGSNGGRQVAQPQSGVGGLQVGMYTARTTKTPVPGEKKNSISQPGQDVSDAWRLEMT